MVRKNSEAGSRLDNSSRIESDSGTPTSSFFASSVRETSTPVRASSSVPSSAPLRTSSAVAVSSPRVERDAQAELKQAGYLDAFGMIPEASQPSETYGRGSAYFDPLAQHYGVGAVDFGAAPVFSQVAAPVADVPLVASPLEVAQPRALAAPRLRLQSPVPRPVGPSVSRTSLSSSPSARVNLDHPNYKPYSVEAGKPDRQREVYCKPRPEDNTPRRGGGGRGKVFIPWCK